MKTEQALMIIEFCLDNLTEDKDLAHVMDLAIQKRFDLKSPKKRNYNKREITE